MCETQNYFRKEIEQDELMSKNHKKVCITYIIYNLNYIKHFLILASTTTGCISIFAFTSLLGKLEIDI